MDIYFLSGVIIFIVTILILIGKVLLLKKDVDDINKQYISRVTGDLSTKDLDVLNAMQQEIKESKRKKKKR